MCGIYGWQLDEGALGFDERYVLAATLAQLNDLRGGHSWGYAADGVCTRGLGRTITDKPTGAEPGDMALAHTLVGHTRFATTGHVTVKNAHPFKVGRVIGAHNGVVYNHGELNARYNRKLPVDSQHIFAHLNEGRRLDDIRAYGAVEYWMASKPEVVRLARFHGGVLAVAELPCGVVWSSDEDHLWDALEEAGLAEEATSMDVHPDVLYVVRNNRIRPKARLEVGTRPRETAYVSTVPTAWKPFVTKDTRARSAKPRPKQQRLDFDQQVALEYARRQASKRGAILFPKKVSS